MATEGNSPVAVLDSLSRQSEPITWCKNHLLHHSTPLLTIKLVHIPFGILQRIATGLDLWYHLSSVVMGTVADTIYSVASQTQTKVNNFLHSYNSLL